MKDEKLTFQIFSSRNIHLFRALLALLTSGAKINRSIGSRINFSYGILYNTLTQANLIRLFCVVHTE